MERRVLSVPPEEDFEVQALERPQGPGIAVLVDRFPSRSARFSRRLPKQ